MFGIKQEILAEQLGLSQQTVSRFESQEELDDATLDKIAKVLKIPAEAIKNMSDEAVISIIANTFQDEAIGYATHYKCTFNPIDKVVELYERMLKTEQEKVIMLEKLIEEKK